MTRILSTNILSPLGLTTEQNYQAARAGRSALRRYDRTWNLKESFCASLFTKEQWTALLKEGFTRFESLILSSVSEALRNVRVDLPSLRTVLVVSTAKGNVEDVEGAQDMERTYAGVSARKIAASLGIQTPAVVVSNACMSGVAAQITAMRLLESGLYDYAVVTGAEVQGRFIVSGFQSFKSLSEEPCRPFDIERLGLNLGEGAATMILTSKPSSEESWVIEDGRIRCDAYHLSSPHPEGEGYYLALEDVKGCGKIATLGVHGTATMYNDQMESKAIARAGLSDIPLTSLKGCFGHTMGAAGILETILMMRALEDGLILGARGFEEIGVSGKVNISSKNRPSDSKTFLKALSGFGGVNAAIRLEKTALTASVKPEERKLRTLGRVRISEREVILNGERLQVEGKGHELLSELYKTRIGDYPKFYKMDALARLAFVGSELLLRSETAGRDGGKDRSVIFFNRSASIVSDLHHLDTIRDADNCYASPNVFLYTLPNLCASEVSIRHAYHGEVSFYILAERNEALMEDIVRSSLLDPSTTSVLAGWLDCPEKDRFTLDLALLERTGEEDSKDQGPVFLK